MSITIAQRKEHLTGQLHGGTLNKVRNIEALFERAGNTMLSKLDPVDTIRTAALAQSIHDDVYGYALPSDFKKPIDLMPQDNRTSRDNAARVLARPFDLNKFIANKQVSIEGSEGTKILRVNWRSRAPKTLHAMNSLTGNGTWSAVGSAANVAANAIFKISGNASIEFDLAASGDGIKNTAMASVDLSDEDEVGDFFVWVYLPSVANVTSLSARWGNDLTLNYWSSTAQTTQADGTAFKVGWNLLRFPWSTATETGTVAPATIDSFQITVAASSALSNVRVDNITVSIGRNFDIKYYSKYLIKNSAGTWLSRTTSDDDVVVLDNDAIQILLLEDLIAAAQQLEGTDSAFDIGWAKKELNGDPHAMSADGRIGLYQRYRGENRSMSKKAAGRYSSGPRFQR